MLNVAILPHHTLWAEFFEHLKFIVVDEIHLYRGVFGSHIANLLRRLKRVAAFYGSSPRMIMTSATIANPVELAENLIEEEVILVEDDGSQKGSKSFVIYNPPIINEEFGIREGLLSASTKIASLVLDFDVQSLVFCRTRKFVELLLREIRGSNTRKASSMRGYRSGYLKKDRREIEAGLKDGSIHLAVATNALELGVDIGGVDAVVLSGYPGSISSLRQRIGRSGRASNASLAVLVTSMNPLDQFMARNPAYLMQKPLERALINPNNPLILLSHIKSAAFEIPFTEIDQFGNLTPADLHEFLEYLCLEGVLQKKKNKYFWLSEAYPSNDYSLRSTISDRILIQHDSEGEIENFGEVDFNSALWMVHPGAIYLQDGILFYVKDLDLEKGIATLIDIQADYLTEPIISVDIDPINEIQARELSTLSLRYGEIQVNTQVTGFRKVDQASREVLSITPLEMPAVKLQTTGFWMVPSPLCINKLREDKLWLSDANDYGKEWKRIRENARVRDNHTCQSCGRVESLIPFHVHHKVPFRIFTSIEMANNLENLVTLCPDCHKLAESSLRIRSGLSGLRYLMANLSPLLVLCESSDLGSHVDPAAKFADNQPAILFYDAIPAGIGLSEGLFNQITDLLEKCLVLIDKCDCKDGCPSCVGPTTEMGMGGKTETMLLVKLLLGETI
jgi:DEAD/DEAH box helicase domain-containing protein